MMKSPIKIKLLGIVGSIIACTAAFAIRSNNEWLLEPSKRQIEIYSPNAFKVKEINGKAWLMNLDGLKIYDTAAPNAFSLSYDSISPVIGGYGLMMDFDSSKMAWKLVGIYDEENALVRNVSGKDKYYVDEFGFFSENMIPVRKDNKKYGYLTPNLIPATKFIYESALPYSEGLAAVSTDKAKTKSGGIFDFLPLVNSTEKSNKNSSANSSEIIPPGNYSYIDLAGKVHQVAPAAGKKFLVCSSFNNGEAVVVSIEGNIYTIDKQLNPVEIVNDPNLAFDEAGVYSANGKSHLVGSKLNPPSEIKGLAIEKVSGGVGLLRISNDTVRVALNTSKTPSEVDSLENLILTHNLNLKGSESIVVADTLGKNFAFKKLSGEELEFSVPKRKIIHVKISDKFGLVKLDTLLKTPSLALWESKLNHNDENSISGISVNVSPRVVTADSKHRASVGVTLKNESGEDKELSISISGTGLTGGGNFKIKLAPGKTKTYYPAFNKIVRKEKRNINIKIDGKTIVKSVEVVPKKIVL